MNDRTTMQSNEILKKYYFKNYHLLFMKVFLFGLFKVYIVYIFIIMPIHHDHRQVIVDARRVVPRRSVVHWAVVFPPFSSPCWCFHVLLHHVLQTSCFFFAMSAARPAPPPEYGVSLRRRHHAAIRTDVALFSYWGRWERYSRLALSKRIPPSVTRHLDKQIVSH